MNSLNLSSISNILKGTISSNTYVSIPTAATVSSYNAQTSMMKEKGNTKSPFSGKQCPSWMTRKREQGIFKGVCGQILFITCPGIITGVRYAELHQLVSK